LSILDLSRLSRLNIRPVPFKSPRLSRPVPFKSPAAARPARCARKPASSVG